MAGIDFEYVKNQLLSGIIVILFAFMVVITGIGAALAVYGRMTPKTALVESMVHGQEPGKKNVFIIDLERMDIDRWELTYAIDGVTYMIMFRGSQTGIEYIQYLRELYNIWGERHIEGTE